MRRSVLLVVASVALGLPAVAAAAPPPADRVITLITGDEVVLTGGSRVAVRPGPGRSHVSFVQPTGTPDISVVPSDAAPLLRDGRLDPRLFNISELERQGARGVGRGDHRQGRDDRRSGQRLGPRAPGSHRGRRGA
jgi:hypothetical protein